MYQTNQSKRALLLGAASVLAIGVAAPAMAQDSSVETVVVTGSRIPQTGLYSSSPVTVVGQQEFKQSGTTNVVDLLNSLPSVFVDQSGSFDNGASGTATIDLRGLGANRTLVLVDGSRLMPGDALDPVADVNIIPAALVDHVEVLTGGASAVYGSDAVAGVVNFILRKDFEGVELTGQYGFNQHDNDNGYARGIFNSADFPQLGTGGFATGLSQTAPTGSIIDGQNENLSMLMGVNSADGKGNITVYAGFQHQQAVGQGARDWSACQLFQGGPKGRICGGSQTYGYVESLDNYFFQGSGSPASVGYFNAGNGKKGGGSFIPYTGAPNQYFNFAHYQFLERPDVRYNAGFEAHYDVSKALTVYSDLMFMNDQTTGQLGPSGIFYGTGPVSGAYSVNCTNPYLSAQENQAACGGLPGDNLITTGATEAALGHPYWDGMGNGVIIPAGLTAPIGSPGNAALLLARRNVEGGPRTYSLHHEAYRIKIGAKGDLGGGWSYDVYGQLGQTNIDESDGGQLLLSNVINALQVDPITGNCISGANGCVGLDVFGGFGAPSKAALSYVTSPSTVKGSTQELVVSGAVTGDLGEWGVRSPWAKDPVALSFGSEYRQESLSFLPDLANQQGLLIGGSATPPISGSYNVKEGFTEVQIPVVEGVPYVEDLTLKGGYRYSSYSLSGSASTFKGEFNYQPVDDVKFRGTYERAVRAPNINELFAPAALGLFTANDPCSKNGVPDATVAHNCATAPGRANVPAGVVGSGLLNCPSSQCVQYAGGNTALKPEIADTRTLGIVFTPSFFDGFTLTVDYFNIHLKDAIQPIAPTTILSGCYGDQATAASQAAFCPYVFRTAGTHSIAINTTSTSTSGYIQAINTNTGGEDTKGLDFESHYTADLDDWGAKGMGSLNFSFVGTWLQGLETIPVSNLTYDTGSKAGTIQRFNCAGLYGDTCGTPNPRWRHKLRVTWESPWDVSLSLDWRHDAHVSLDTNTGQPLLANGHDGVDANMSSMDWFDLSASWTVREGVDLTAGVDNVFDKDPPLTTVDPSATNTYPGAYDTLGRYFFMQATVKL